MTFKIVLVLILSVLLKESNSSTTDITDLTDLTDFTSSDWTDEATTDWGTTDDSTGSDFTDFTDGSTISVSTDSSSGSTDSSTNASTMTTPFESSSISTEATTEHNTTDTEATTENTTAATSVAPPDESEEQLAELDTTLDPEFWVVDCDFFESFAEVLDRCPGVDIPDIVGSSGFWLPCSPSSSCTIKFTDDSAKKLTQFGGNVFKRGDSFQPSTGGGRSRRSVLETWDEFNETALPDGVSNFITFTLLRNDADKSIAIVDKLAIYGIKQEVTTKPTPKPTPIPPKEDNDNKGLLIALLVISSIILIILLLGGGYFLWKKLAKNRNRGYSTKSSQKSLVEDGSLKSYGHFSRSLSGEYNLPRVTNVDLEPSTNSREIKIE